MKNQFTKHTWMFLIAAILLTTASICQEVSFMTEQKIFGQPDDGREIIELWTNPKSTIGFPRQLAVTSRSELFIWNHSGHLVRLNSKGKVKTINNINNYPTSCLHNGKVYSYHERYNAGVLVKTLQLLNESGRYQGELLLTGNLRSLFDSELFIDSMGNFIFVLHPYGGGPQVYKYNKDGEFLSAWIVAEAAPDIEGLVGHFCLTRENNLAGYAFRTQEIVVFNSDGSLLNHFPVYKYSNIEIDVTPEGKFFILDKSTGEVDIYEGDGTLEKSFTFENPFSKQSYFSQFSFAQNGNIYVYDSKNQNYSVFDQGGKYIHKIASPYQLIEPAQKLTDVENCYSGKELGLTQEGNIINFDESKGRLYLLSPDGELLKSGKLNDECSNCLEFQVLPNGNLIFLFKDKIKLFNKNFRYIDEWGGFENAVDMQANPSGELYLITAGEGDASIIKFNPEGKIIFRKNKWGTSAGKFTDPKSLAVSSDNELFIVTDQKRVAVFGQKGRFIRSVDFSFHLSGEYSIYGVDFSSNGKLIIHLGSGFLVCNKDLAIKENFVGFPGSCIGDMVTDQHGRYFILDCIKGGIFSFNPSGRYDATGSTGSLAARVDTQKAPVQPGYADRNIYLQGIDKNGIPFLAVNSLDTDSYYSFQNIPIGSGYIVWTDSFHLINSYIKKPFLQGRMNKESKVINFKTAPLPENFVRVFGCVKNRFGIPVHGVQIQAGKFRAITDLNGKYTLYLPGDEEYEITAHKDGCNFRKQSKNLKTTSSDKLFVNFKTK